MPPNVAVSVPVTIAIVGEPLAASPLAAPITQ
jgi:hypothetical protein